MYLKIIYNGNKVYYLLCVKDSKKNIWVERFINSTLATVLMDEDIKVIEY